MNDILRSYGIDDIKFAHDGQELLTQTARMNPRIVIANSRLPKLSGLEFTRKVRGGHGEINRALSIIVATNTATHHFLNIARESGVDEILVRPFTAAALQARVEAVLIRPRRFIDSISYVGPCRRRRLLEDYGGPLRRFADPLAEAGALLWEIEANRDLVKFSIGKVLDAAKALSSTDRTTLRALYETVLDLKQLSNDVRDQAMADAARSLSRYITAIGAARELDEDVIITHTDAMQQLCALTSADSMERFRLARGLVAIVDKRLGRTPVADDDYSVIAL
ncbi:MAG: response regulator [Caulobacterales bacterium]